MPWTPDAWHALAQSLGRRDPAYGISTMYVEYQNVADPSDPVTPPTDLMARPYYDALAASTDRDYLRLPLLLEPSLVVDPAASGLLAADRGNLATFLAQTAGTSGVAGKPFSAAARSKVYGVALVATPAPDDPTRDLVLQRIYHATADQQVVPASGNLTVAVSVPFTIA